MPWGGDIHPSQQLYCFPSWYLGMIPIICPHPGDFSCERAPSEHSFSPLGECSTSLPQSQSGWLHFLDHVRSDNGATDDGNPSYIPYIIERRVTLNNQVLAKDTEQDLDSAPSSYWQQIKQKAERVLHQKINCNQLWSQMILQSWFL